MRKVITATLIAAAALSTTAALANGDNAATEQRAKLNALWGNSVSPAVSAPASKQVSTTRDTSVGGAFEGVFFGVDKNSGSYKALKNLRSTQPSRADR